MAEEQEDTGAPLSDTQRIDNLEASVKFHRMLVIALGALTVVLLTMVITAIFVLPGKARQGAAGGQQMATVSASLEEQTETILRLEEGLKRMEEVQAAYVETMDRMGVIDRTRQTEAMLSILLQQHADYRDAVRVLKNGMNDLARMVPGSRTWLQEYTERLNRGLDAAGDRESTLLQFQETLKETESAQSEEPPS